MSQKQLRRPAAASAMNGLPPSRRRRQTGAAGAATSNRHRRFHGSSKSSCWWNFSSYLEQQHHHHRRRQLRLSFFGFIVVVMAGIHLIDLARVHTKMRQLELIDFNITASLLQQSSSSSSSSLPFMTLSSVLTRSISVYSSSSSNIRRKKQTAAAGSVTTMTIQNLEYDPHWQYHHLDNEHGVGNERTVKQFINVSYNVIHDQLPFAIPDISKTLCGGSKCLLGLSQDWHRRNKNNYNNAAAAAAVPEGKGGDEEEVGFLVAKNHHNELDANATLHMERWYRTYRLAKDIATEFVGSSTLLVGPPEIHETSVFTKRTTTTTSKSSSSTTTAAATAANDNSNNNNNNINQTIFHDLEYFMVHNKSQSPLRIKGLGWVDDPDRAKAHLLGDMVDGNGDVDGDDKNSKAEGRRNAFDDVADDCVCWCEPGHTCVLKAADGQGECDTTSTTKIVKCEGKGLELIKPLLMQKVSVVPSPNLKVQYLMDDDIVLDIRYHLAFLEKIWPTGTSLSASAGSTPSTLSTLPSGTSHRPPDMKTINSFLMNLRSGMRQLRSIFEKYRCLYHDTQWMVDYTGRVHHIDLDRCWTGGEVKSQYREGQDSKRYRRDKFLNSFQKCLSIAIMGRYNPDLEFYTYYNIDEYNTNSTVLLRRPDQYNPATDADDRENWLVADIPGLRARVYSDGVPDYKFLDGLNTSRAHDCYLL